MSGNKHRRNDTIRYLNFTMNLQDKIILGKDLQLGGRWLGSKIFTWPQNTWPKYQLQSEICFFTASNLPATNYIQKWAHAKGSS